MRDTYKVKTVINDAQFQQACNEMGEAGYLVHSWHHNGAESPWFATILFIDRTIVTSVGA